MTHKLKTGQINFESTKHIGAYAVVVIRDGKFHNLTDELRGLLIEALTAPAEEEPNLEDMF